MKMDRISKISEKKAMRKLVEACRVVTNHEIENRGQTNATFKAEKPLTDFRNGDKDIVVIGSGRDATARNTFERKKRQKTKSQNKSELQGKKNQPAPERFQRFVIQQHRNEGVVDKTHIKIRSTNNTAEQLPDSDTPSRSSDKKSNW